MFGYKRSYYSRGSRYTLPRKPVTATFSRGSSTAKALGNARAAKNGSKTENYNCSVNGIITFNQPANEYYGMTKVFSPCFGGVDSKTGQVRDSSNGGIYGGLVNDRGFRLRCAQYDEYRIVSMRVKLMPQNTPGSNAATVIQPSAILSICDRCAVREELQVLDDDLMTDIDGDTPSPREIEESAGVIITQWNNNRINSIMRTVFARTLTEKEYCDATITYTDTDGVSPTETLAQENIPQFAPAIYFCIKSTSTSEDERTFKFSYTVEYNVIFRNPKSDLQTFIIKENPKYKNGDEDDDNRARRVSKYTTIKSTNPLIPDTIIDSSGKETNMSWFKRYLARVAIKQLEHSIPSITDTDRSKTTETIIIPAQETKTETKMTDEEDEDPGTAEKDTNLL